MALKIALWLLLHGSVTVSENPEHLDTQGKPEAVIWVKFEGITF